MPKNKNSLYNQINLKQKILQKQLYSLKILEMNEEKIIELLKNEKEENPLLEFEENDFFNSKIVRKEDKNDFELIENIGEKYNTREVFLKELKLQINNEKFSEKEEKILDYILNSLDDNGFLDINLNSLVRKFGIKLREIKGIIEQIKNIYPGGVGCKNIKEFLKYQLAKTKFAKNKELIKIINYYFEDLKNPNKIAKKSGIKIEKVLEYIDIIKNLKIKPLKTSLNDKVEFVVPDIIFKKVNNEWKVFLNDNIYRNIKINETYLAMKKSVDNDELKEYINEKIKKINFIKSCILQRNNTLQKIGKIILDKQSDYFENNDKIKVLTQKELAKELNVHESTVSRAIKDKYIEFSGKVMAINSFFVRGYLNRNNELVSSLEIKKYILEIVEREKEKNSYYSDKEISEIIERKYNLKISRRTITKYRDELNIKNRQIRKLSR